ncbi:MAG: hypothetical protein P1V97_30310 [Planctomycetota bacterium]|nr:hypothetical protein [Planctomycetota bacterium]
MKQILTLILLATLLSGCHLGQAQSGARRWQKFSELDPSKSAPEPTISTDKDSYRVKETFTVSVSAEVACYFYILMMLPNNDVYLLTPSNTFKNHQGKELSYSPKKSEIELFVPDLKGTVYLGVIASPLNLSLLSEGWLPAEEIREFDTWPADVKFNSALDYMAEAFDEKPWALATTSFKIKP